jgi:hypothetical protein
MLENSMSTWLNLLSLTDSKLSMFRKRRNEEKLLSQQRRLQLVPTTSKSHQSLLVRRISTIQRRRRKMTMKPSLEYPLLPSQRLSFKLYTLPMPLYSNPVSPTRTLNSFDRPSNVYLLDPSFSVFSKLSLSDSARRREGRMVWLA